MRSTHYTRATVPTQYRHYREWPDVDLNAMDPELSQMVGARKKAIISYLEWHKVREITSETGVSRSEMVRLLNRCLKPHDDGRIFGWRALLPWRHVQSYVRLANRTKSAGGNAGAFAQFLREHPEIEGPLNEAILTTKQRDALSESRFSHRGTYGRFKRLCIDAGISMAQYPLNNSDAGKRAVRRYARELLLANFVERAARLGGPNARLKAKLDLGVAERFTSAIPFDLVSLDSHRLNFIGCLGVREGQGVTAIPIHRLSFLPVIDLGSSCVLGYHVAIGLEPSAQDVVRAVKAALTPWKPRELTLPGHTYPEAAKMPSAAIPETAGLCWNAILLDNATIHCAKGVSEDLRRRLGCAINFGPVRQWYRRPLVESLFSALERSGFTRLPNSVGYGPADPLRGNGAAGAVKYRMMLEEMLDLIDIVVCTYNATPRPRLGHLSPLQVLKNAMLCAPMQWLPRILPQLPSQVPDIGVEKLTVTVRGSVQQGRRPYIQYRGVHYASPVLSRAYSLVGQQVRIHVPHDDLRTVKAFLSSGEEIGVLTAGAGWSVTPHDRKLRQEVLNAIKDNKLAVGPDEDPIQKYLVLKRWELVKGRRTRPPSKRNKISPEATSLARALHAAKNSVVSVPAAPDKPNAVDKAPPAPRDALPSFVPQLRHRGVQK